MNAAGTMMAFSASIFLLSAQLKLISASLDSTTWPFFVQLGPCMSFQSFTQMHFYCFFFERPQHHVLNAFISLPNVFEWTRGLKFFLHKTAPNPFANVSTQLILVNLWISEVGCCCYYYCKCCCFCVYRWLPSVPPAALKRKTSRAPVQLNTHTHTDVDTCEQEKYILFYVYSNFLEIPFHTNCSKVVKL